MSGTIITSQILDEEFQGIEMGDVIQREFIEVPRINRVGRPDLFYSSTLQKKFGPTMPILV